MILLNTGQRTGVNLHELIVEVQLKNGWNTGIDFRVGQLPVITASRAQMELLFTSLIQNSVQFRDTDRPLCINIELLPPRNQGLSQMTGKKYECIAVSDNGSGVKEEFLEKIFGLFQKIEVSRYTTMQSGMGLSFCKRILLNHGGFVSARKSGEKGLTILLFFPKNH